MNCSRCSAEAVVKRDNAFYCGKCAMARDWEDVIAVLQSDGDGVVVFGGEEPAAAAPAPAPEPVAVAAEAEPSPAPEPEPVAAAPAPEPVASAPEPEPEPEPAAASEPVAATNGAGDLPPADPFG